MPSNNYLPTFLPPNLYTLRSSISKVVHLHGGKYNGARGAYRVHR